jgi:YVTN family beta-propeller protein
MKFASALLAVSCLLSAASGQWVEKTIGLPDSLSGLRDPGSMLYNPGSNVLFISGSNGLLLVDGLSNRVVARTPLTDFGSAARCYASQVNKVYWVGGGYNDNAVYSLDEASGRVLARVSVSYPDGICYNPVVNKVYVLGGYESSSLTIINAARDSIVRTLNLGGQWASSLCCNPGDNKVYFTLYDNAMVGVIDCDVDTIRRSISVSVEPEGLVYNRVSNKLYCYSYDTLTIIDGHSDSIIKRVALTGPPAQVAYNPTANKLYCADDEGIDIICGFGDTLITRLEPVRSVTAFAFDSTDNLMWYSSYYYSDTLVAIDGQGDTLCGVVAVGDEPGSLCYNPNRNRLYVTQHHLAVIDPAAKRVDQRILLSFTPTALCWAKSANKVYCAGLGEASVAVISSQQNLLLRLVPVGQEPRALVYDRPLGLVCCANSGDSTVSIITCNGDSVTGTVYVGSGPYQLCVDTVLHKVWCNTYSGVAVIDLRAESLAAVLPLSGTAALLADPAHSRVWCATRYDGHVVVLDAAGDSIIASIPVGGEVSALCLIPNANLVCCATRSNNAVAVIDGATNRVVSIIPVGEIPQALLYNQRRNKLYCANAGSNDVTAIDCATLTPVATIPVGLSPEALAYDSAGDRTYCACPNADSVTVIGCRRDTVVARIRVGENPVAMAYASTQRRMFVANQYGSSLSVIRDTVRVGVEEGLKDEDGRVNVGPTVVRGLLFLDGDCPRTGTVPKAALLDISGRKVLDLNPGANDVRRLAPGVYFVREERTQAQAQAQAVRKVVVTH